MERMTMNPTEAAKVLGISRPTLYALMRQDGFPSFKVGSRRLISRAGLERWIAEQEGGEHHAHKND